MTTIEYAMSVAAQLQNENKVEQAKTILNTILDVNPDHAHALHLLGIIAYQAGKTAEAIQLMQKAIAHHPTVALFQSNLGEMYRQLNDIELSIQYGQSAITLDPNSATALSNLGIAYYDAKQYEQALNCHKRALAIDPQFACSLNNMGSIYAVLANTHEAIKCYQAAIAASAHFADPYNNLGTLYLQKHEFKLAFDYLTHAIKLMPTFADAHCNLGFTLLGLDQYNEAFHYFEKSLHLKPNYAEAYYGIARVHLQNHDFILAEQFIHKAIAAHPHQAEFYQLLAEIYQEQGKNTQAFTCLDHAISINSMLSSLYISKGKIYMDMGEAAKAEEQFSKAMEDPAIEIRLLAHYSLVQLRKTKSNNPNLQALLSIAHNIQEISPQKQEYVYFALGKCYDDMGEWDKAFTYFSQGCSLKRSRITYDIRDQIQLTNQIIHHFNIDRIEYLRRFANPSSLPIFIVGMPRSGTTLVEQILSCHTTVYGAGELRYLSNFFQKSLEDQAFDYRDITDKYLVYLRHLSSDAIHITDKMPNNYIAVGFIHALFPNAKIIHIKRNPIDTCLSCYTKLFSQGQHYSYDLTELGQYYNNYEMIMNHWRNTLPAHAWLEIEYENVIQNLEVETKRILSFCNLSWNPACLTFYQSKRNVRTASFMQVRQPIYTSSIQRWRNFESQLDPLIKVLKNYPLQRDSLNVQSLAQQQT